MEIFLIDGIGPFFRSYAKQKINWSKIPFQHLHRDPAACRKQFETIGKDLDTFASRVSEVGYNSISLDDVAHVTPDDWLEPEINQLVKLYREEYRRLFAICNRHNLDVYLTMDILSLTPALKKIIKGNRKRATQFLYRQVESVLRFFPEVKGLILRIGECDGKDVKGAFNSELILQTPGQVNRLIRELLPLFELHRRFLILRTWTVGAYPIGDFIWHKDTAAKVLRSVKSPYLILSMKYGESDFFRYLPLNKHFLHLEVKKIIELQARREYEGCGEYPSFIGWDYQQYARQLKDVSNMVGMSVWCQTGGWVPFRRLTFLEPAGIWNEINSYVCLKLFAEQQSVEQAVTDFAKTRGCNDSEKFLRLLRLSDEVVKELLYIEEIAVQKLFFRRVRIPPLFNVLWNNIFINDSVRKTLSTYVTSGEHCIDDGRKALVKIKEMEQLAKELNLPADDIAFMYDTFAILALAREYYFSPFRKKIRKKIQKAKKRYKEKYPKENRPRYRIKTNFTPFALKRRHLKWVGGLFVRRTRGYRVLDHFITLHLLGYSYRFFVFLHPKSMPKFARKKAMGIDVIFK